MKKQLFLTAGFMFIALTALAQRAGSSSSSTLFNSSSDEGITFGVEVGANFANLGGDLDDLDSRVGLRIGVNVNFPISNGFFVRTGLEYSEKGAKWDYKEDDDYAEEMKISLNYLEIPILASYAYSFSDNFALSAHIGPYIAYAISGNIHEKYADYYDEDVEIYDIDAFDTDEGGFFKRFDFGLRFGIGATIASHFNVGIGYEIGLTNIYDAGIYDAGDEYDEYDDYYDYSIKNKNFYISVGYTF